MNMGYDIYIDSERSYRFFLVFQDRSGWIRSSQQLPYFNAYTLLWTSCFHQNWELNLFAWTWFKNNSRLLWFFFQWSSSCYWNVAIKFSRLFKDSDHVQIGQSADEEISYSDNRILKGLKNGAHFVVQANKSKSSCHSIFAIAIVCSHIFVYKI